MRKVKCERAGCYSERPPSMKPLLVSSAEKTDVLRWGARLFFCAGAGGIGRLWDTPPYRAADGRGPSVSGHVFSRLFAFRESNGFPGFGKSRLDWIRALFVFRARVCA